MSKPYTDICKKWNVTPEEVVDFVNFIGTDKNTEDRCGNINVLLAASDLMYSNDISPWRDQNGG